MKYTYTNSFKVHFCTCVLSLQTNAVTNNPPCQCLIYVRIQCGSVGLSFHSHSGTLASYPMGLHLPLGLWSPLHLGRGWEKQELVGGSVARPVSGFVRDRPTVVPITYHLRLHPNLAQPSPAHSQARQGLKLCGYNQEKEQTWSLLSYDISAHQAPCQRQQMCQPDESVGQYHSLPAAETKPQRKERNSQLHQTIFQRWLQRCLPSDLLYQDLDTLPSRAETYSLLDLMIS